MNLFVFQSVKCHMFASLKYVGAVVLENKFKVVDSLERDQLLAVFELFFES